MTIPLLRRIALSCALLICAILVHMITQASPAYAQNDPPVSLSISPAAEIVEPDTPAYLTITMENISGANIPQLQLVLTLDGQVDQVRIIPDTEATTGVRVDGVRRSANRIVWRGGLASDGKLVFAVAARSAPIDQAITLSGAAGPVDGDPVVNASATVTVNAYDLNPNDLSFSKVLLWNDGSGLTEGENGEVLPGQKVGMELRLTNNSPAVVYTLLVDQMAPSEGTGTAGESRCMLQPVASSVVQGRGFSVPVSALGDKFQGEESFTYAFLVRTLPGETSITRTRAQVVGEPDCALEGQAQAYSTAAAPGGTDFTAEGLATASARQAEDAVAPRLAFIESLLQQQPLFSRLVALLILLSDFGDAPDSTNPPDENIPAYPGIDGRFPTVFDPATGLPQGPRHHNGIPLHLGQRVSGEFFVDLGLRRNLDPPNELADLDLHDDGVDPNTLNFSHCVPTTIPFDVTVTQQAVDYVNENDAPLYLNIWLDGNHDGDWEDSLNCDMLTAVEHIVIDQEIAPAAAGTLSLLAPTNNLPVPATGEGETMWLRVTVSDEPSVKTGQYQNPGRPPVEYGDGQGPATGYRWGETEDYLYVPQAAIAAPGGIGADLSLSAEAVIQGDFGGATAAEVSAAAADGWEEGVAALKLRIRNRGDRLARAGLLTIEMNPYLGIPDDLTLGWTGCLTCTVAAANRLTMASGQEAALDLPVEEVCNGDACRLEIQLGDIPPGAPMELVMHYADCNSAGCTGAGDGIEFRASVSSENDTNTGNNAAVRRALRLLREPVITAPAPGQWTGCLTCTVAFKGFAQPGTTVSLLSDAFGDSDYSALADERGFWQIDAFLPDGIHQIELGWTGCLTCTVAAAGAQAADLNAAGEAYGEQMSLTVDRTLIWNPNSFGYTRTSLAELQGAAVAKDDDTCGPWGIADDAGRMELDNWRMPVWSGKEIELGVELLCESGGAASLRYANQEVSFQDDDGDGYFTALFTPEIGDEALDAELAVSCGVQSAASAGKMIPVTPVLVQDAETGDPLPGMTVQLFRANSSAQGDNAGAEAGQFTLWEADAFGQSNPQTTDATGAFSYIVPQGRYGLVVSGPGYQSYRAGPFRDRGPISGFNIGMPPALTADGTQPSAVVQITEDGFLPAMLEVAPGATVEWLNVGLDMAGTQAAASAVTAASADAVSWDSGLLLSGESHTIRFDEEGVYTYRDPADPARTAIVKVAQQNVPPDGESMSVYLPVVQK
ncbi:MAG: hypothetical protein H6642_04310 [Caldilineaceae bacterium]|nr:hypothetical protein [Caldilineaceae bacterium]